MKVEMWIATAVYQAIKSEKLIVDTLGIFPDRVTARNYALDFKEACGDAIIEVDSVVVDLNNFNKDRSPPKRARIRG